MLLHKNFQASASDAKLSPALWDRVPLENMAPHGNPGLGWYRCYDWIDEAIYDATTWEFTGWQLTANSGTAVPTAGNGGLLRLSATSTNGQGPQIQLGDVAWIDFDATSRVTMELYGTPSGISTVGPEFFFGLAVEDTTVIASGANSATDYVGVQRVAADVATKLGGVSLKADGSVSGTAAFTNASANLLSSAIKIGMQITRDGAEFYINGDKESASLGSSNISRVAMMPTLVWQGNGTDTPVFDCDWLAIAVER